MKDNFIDSNPSNKDWIVGFLGLLSEILRSIRKEVRENLAFVQIFVLCIQNQNTIVQLFKLSIDQERT